MNTEVKIRKRLLDAFLRGETLTTFTGNQEGHTVDFRKQVSNLRREGYPILDNWAKSKDNRRFKEYFISDADRFKILIDEKR